MNILVLDNYDSFTYNLVHIIRELGHAHEVHRNDKISIEEVNRFDKILISPGPGIPDEAGIMKAVVEKYGPTKGILGVCLGHQGIAEVYGSKIYNIKNVLHGVTSELRVTASKNKLFRGLPERFRVTHYHSWAVAPDSVNGNIQVTATNEAGLVMAFSHKQFDVHGVQFHPESVMTQNGKALISNWLND